MPRPSLPSRLVVRRTGVRFAMVYEAALMSEAFMKAADSSKRVYLSLCFHASRDERAWELSAAQLARETYQTERSVWRALRDLCARGLVSRIRQARTEGGELLQGDQAEGHGWKVANIYLVHDEGPVEVTTCSHCGSPFHTSDEHNTSRHQPMQGRSRPPRKQVPEPPNSPEPRTDSAVTTGTDSAVSSGTDSAVTSSTDRTELPDPSPVAPPARANGRRWETPRPPPQTEEALGKMAEAVAALVDELEASEAGQLGNQVSELEKSCTTLEQAEPGSDELLWAVMWAFENSEDIMSRQFDGGLTSEDWSQAEDLRRQVLAEKRSELAQKKAQLAARPLVWWPKAADVDNHPQMAVWLLQQARERMPLASIRKRDLRAALAAAVASRGLEVVA